MHARILARRARIAAGILLALALLGWCAWLFACRWRPPVKDFPLQGIDVSAQQGPVNWWAVRATGIQFAYVRATVGADRRDGQFEANWSGVYSAGLRRGAIHVFSLCQLAHDQAANFVTQVPRSGDMLPAAVELDFHGDCPARPEREVVIGELTRLLQAVETHTGKPALLKVARAFEARYRISEAIPRKLWSEQAFFPPAYSARPWTMWQATRFRRIEGVATAVNWDVVAS